MSKMIWPVTGLWLCAFASLVQAAPGDWDRTFAQNGRISLVIPNQPVRLRTWELQPDGKVVVVGHTTTEVYPGTFLENSEFVVARFNSSGALDASFDGDGYLTFAFGSDSIGTVDLERQADGKLLIAGQAGVPSGIGSNTTDRIRLLRLNTDGSRDTTYGPNGEVLLTFPNSYFNNPGLKILANGSALVYGDFGVNDGSALAGIGLVRVTSAGQLDSSFGTGGLAVFRGTNHLSLYKVGIAADGSIVVGATIGPFSTYIPVVGRVTSAGVADSTFGTGGVLQLPFLQGNGWITAITPTPDGRVLVAGKRYDSNGSELPFIARISHDGTLDATFGSAGRIIPDASQINSLLVEPDGRIVAAGSSAGSLELPGFLARYNIDGSPDPDFGVRGIARTDFATTGNGAWSFLSELLRNPDGSYLALATTYMSPGPESTDSLVRLLAQGSAAGVLGIRAEYENSGAFGFALSESAGHARFFVTRTGGTDGAVSVQYRVIAENATAGQDFTPVSGTLNFNDGESTASFDVPVHDDDVPEQNVDERFYAEIFNPTGGAGISKPRATIQFSRDYDTGTHIEFLSNSTVSVLEGSVARIVLHRARFFTDAVTVNYTITAQTATAGADYTGTGGSVQWAAGEGGLRFIDIPTVNDGTNESDEYIIVNFSDPSGLANFNGAYNNITIFDDDSATNPVIAFDNHSVSVSESAANLTWTVRRAGDASQILNVPWTLNPGAGVHGATAGQDYTSVNGTLTWNGGDSTPKTITVPLLGDTTLELFEYLSVALNAPVQVFGGSFAGAYIVDNDGAIVQPTITLSAGGPVSESVGTVNLTATLSGIPEGAVSAHWNLNYETAFTNDVASITGSFYWAPGDTSPKVIPITIIPDTRDEIDETFNISVTDPVGGAALVNPLVRYTIVDDDMTPAGQPAPVPPGVELVAPVTVSENAQTAQIQLRRVGEVSDGLSVSLFTQDGTATAPSDFARTFAGADWGPGETAVKTVEVQLNGDTVAESSESLTVRTAVFSYGGNPNPQNFAVTITDDDGASPPPPPPARVAFVNAAETIPESATSITLQISRTGNTSVASSVDYATTSVTAGIADFSGTAGTLTWAAGDTANKSLTITLLPDTTDEPDETFTVTLSAPSSGTQIDAATTTVTITDNDLPGQPPPSGGGGGVSSGGKKGGGGAESYLSLLALSALLGWRRHRRRPSVTSA